MEIILWIAGGLYVLAMLFMAVLLLIPFSMMSGDPIPPKHWVWLFYFPAVITWPIFPVWIRLTEWIDDHLPPRR